jgi:hypothetical protein
VREMVWLLLLLLSVFIVWPIALKLASRPKKKPDDWNDD